MTDHDEEFEGLLERSSLGTDGARQLRGRTPAEQVERVRRIVLLRERMANGSIGEAAEAEAELAELLGRPTRAAGATAARAHGASIRVLVVRDDGYFGVPVRALLTGAADIDYVGTLEFGPEVAELAAASYPSVIIFDTQYMVSQVLPIAAELHARIPGCSLVMFADPAKRGMLPPRRHVSLNFLLKDLSQTLLVDSIRRLAAGERVVSPVLQAASLDADRALSTRELEVLGLAAEGGSVREIANRLYLSGGTVRSYLSAVIAKTGARNRLDAIRIARRDGWLH